MNRPPRLHLVLPIFALVAAAPLAAQQGQDLLASEEPLGALAEHVFLKGSVSDVVFHEAGDISLVEAAVSDPTRVASAATTEYKYDDGTAEEFTNVGDAYEQEYAQRFRLPRAGTVTSATACFGRPQDDDNANVSFVLTFYRDSGGRPGNQLASYSATASGLARARWTCVNVNRGDITRQRLGSGDTWLSVRWQNSTGKVFVEDRNGPGGTRNFWRARSSSGGSWGSWNADNEVTAYFIRLGVDHGGTTPDPDPEPPPPTSGCTPTTTALRFDGGYGVSMCYRTPDGQVGQAKSGVWASSQSGILWFFDRENAEALVKVLDGCAHNGHRWVFVAPVTTLEFNLWVTGPNGKRWTHSNRQGQTASSRSDNRAFQCSDEGDDDEDDEGDEDDTSVPDLVVSSPSVSDGSPSAGGRFTLRATVRNQGDGRSASTTLRYYRSSDSRISISDTQIGTDAVSALSASGSSSESISLTAPSSAGTYYYGACVDSVPGESNTGNNCSTAARITVSDGGGSGARYNVGDVIETLPFDSWSFNGALSACSFGTSGGKTNVQCQRNGFVERLPYRYTCGASTCRIEGRTVTEGAWLETRR
ncbi:MAG: hypothetical protein OXR83_03890 [Acidobacteriota bacterium]|nr:hypothetical protein [Acidobacteriota bacterium]